MKTAAKRLISFVMVLCIACIGIVCTPMITAKAADYVETSFGEGKMLITTTFNGSTYYLPATTTSSGPLAKSFGNVSEIGEEHLWTVTATGSNYYIQNSDGKYLYTTNDNNGVRVGTTQHAWAYDASANSFKNTTTNRYLGIYNAQNWRCYTTVNQTNYKESSTSFKFYTVNAAAPSVTVSGNDYTQVGETLTLTTELANVSGDVTWSSSDTNVADVTQDGVVTAKGMGKTTITASVNSVEGTKEITVYPKAGSELSIADALTVCGLTGTSNAPYTYSTTGMIESIDTAYSSTNNNITVTISDGNDSIKAYRMAGGDDLEVGKKITVTGTLVNYGGNTPEFIAGCTYEIVVDENAEAIQSSLNAVNAYMSMAYKYKETVNQVEVSSEVTDTLDVALTDVTSNSYTSWTGKTSNSAAVYAGMSAKGNSSIQLNNNTKYPGIITTTSGGTVKTVTVTWNSSTSNGRTLNVYGKNEAYSTANDLYDSTKQGELLGTIVCGTSTTLTIEGNYTFIGLQSKASAMYLTSVEITWDTGKGGTETETVLENSQFLMRCGVDASLLDIENVDACGIRVTANGKSVDYTTTASSWTVEDGKAYVLINLGDIASDLTKLGTEFTVEAFVTVGNFTYTSELSKTYSVASYIKECQGIEGCDVEHLYNYLVENNVKGAV